MQTLQEYPLIALQSQVAVLANEAGQTVIRTPEPQLGAESVNVPASFMNTPSPHLLGESTAVSVSTLAVVINPKTVIDAQLYQAPDVSAPASAALYPGDQHVVRAPVEAAEPVDFHGMQALHMLVDRSY